MRKPQSAEALHTEQLHAWERANNAVSALMAFREVEPPLLKEEAEVGSLRVVLPLNNPYHPNRGKRFGDLLLSQLVDFKALTVKRDTAPLLCGCGATHMVALTTLRRYMTHPKTFYFPPLCNLRGEAKESLAISEKEKEIPDLREHFLASRLDSGALFVCPHITRDLAEAFPQAADYWRKVRNHMAGALGKVIARESNDIMDQPMTAPWEWFRRDYGLFLFLRSVGMPPRPGMVLKRKLVLKHYSADQFYWADRKRAMGQVSPDDTITLNLRQRMLAAKARAKELGRPFLFTDLNHFLKSIPPLPGDFEENPRRWRLQYAEQAFKGIGPDNAFWTKIDLREERKEENFIGKGNPLQGMGKILGAESDSDAVSRLEYYFNEINKLVSQELYAADPDFVKNGSGKPVQDVYTTLLRRVREAELKD